MKSCVLNLNDVHPKREISKRYSSSTYLTHVVLHADSTKSKSMLGVRPIVVAVLLATVAADQSANTCARNNLTHGVRDPGRGDGILISKSVQSNGKEHIVWHAQDPRTTFITQIQVIDQIGGGMSARPFIVEGGEHHSYVHIGFLRDHGLQVVDIRLKIWGFTLQPGDAAEVEFI